MQQIPDSVPADVKHVLQNFPSNLRTVDVMSTPTHGVEHHIHTDSRPPVFAKSRRLDPEKIYIAKAEFKHLESPALFAVGFSFAHDAQKRWILATLWRFLPSQFGHNP
jgi:hypothetical protein